MVGLNGLVPRFNENETCQCFDNATILNIVIVSKVYSAAVVGVDALEIEVEVHADWGEEGCLFSLHRISA